MVGVVRAYVSWFTLFRVRFPFIDKSNYLNSEMDRIPSGAGSFSFCLCLVDTLSLSIEMYQQKLPAYFSDIDRMYVIVPCRMSLTALLAFELEY